MKPWHKLQNLRCAASDDLVRLGSDYGGWVFQNGPELKGSTIISAGLGEDASFDVEFSSLYDATVIIADPTPRAVAHFEEITARFGHAKSTPYVSGGKQPVEAYNLSHASSETLRFSPLALWNAADTVTFYAPPNPAHVSHSILNWQRPYGPDTQSIEVPCETIAGLLRRHGLAHADIPLLKLDIEGAEVEVIDHMLQHGFLPRQILLEYDELLNPSPEGAERVSRTHARLEQAGYSAHWHDAVSNFCYLR